MQYNVESLSSAVSSIPSEDSLSVLDNRTGRMYTIPVERNAVSAIDFAQIKGSTFGADPVDRVDAGLRVFDPGFLNTAVVESSMTFVDGKQGTIHYREHSLDNLVRDNDWEDVVYMLNWGSLPTSDEKKQFRRALADAMPPPQAVVNVITAFPRDALNSSLIQAGLSAYASCDEGSRKLHGSVRPQYLGNMPRVDAAIVRSLSALATTIALTYCHKRGKSFTSPDPHSSFIGNVLLMMGFSQNGKPDPKVERCFEKLWVLYADHEMTNSTAAFLHASSTLTDPISALTSAIVSAYGPLHGAAIDMAYHGFEQMGSPAGVPAFIEGVKAGRYRLFGYGHRIYKTVDPRAKWIRAMISEHQELVYSNKMLQIAMEVDRIASSDEYFTSRKLKANADLYGCFLYTAMGFETDIIVAMASLSRAGGVLAHWREAMHEKSCLWRPMQIFTGSISGAQGAKL
ncbi:citrate synthase [Lophiotrema nucula]|uniref:Citrate synthase n=1 Tax=Lophiotrema nucula TaxID=690887 RepID=A0A6A5Z5E5_9PLEO|nr:citrate synthase [Lophiotrema nucula]